jgi:hypothetical protein
MAADKSIYRELVNSLYLIMDLIVDSKLILEERAMIMSSLSNDAVPEEIYPLIALSGCGPTGQLEHHYINSCQNFKSGLYCELDISIYKGVETYTKYVPVNYENVQLVASSINEMFVSNSDGQFGILDCGEIETSPYNPDDQPLTTDLTCTFALYDNKCIKAIEREEYLNILTHCNFTSTIPELVTRTPLGLLIMNHDRSLVIKEIGSTQKIKNTISSKTPLLLQTPNTVQINLGGLDLTFRPLSITIERRVNYTRLPEYFIKGMVKSAQKFDLLKELGISEYAHIVTLALLLLIVPITCGLCICTLKDSSIFQKCKDSRAIKLARDVPTRVRNAQNNFRFVKNRIFSEN